MGIGGGIGGAIDRAILKREKRGREEDRIYAHAAAAKIIAHDNDRGISVMVGHAKCSKIKRERKRGKIMEKETEKDRRIKERER